MADRATRADDAASAAAGRKRRRATEDASDRAARTPALLPGAGKFRINTVKARMDARVSEESGGRKGSKTGLEGKRESAGGRRARPRKAQDEYTGGSNAEKEYDAAGLTDEEEAAAVKRGGGSGDEREEEAPDMATQTKGFASAVQKIMGRTITKAAPVLAKRHTAAEKMAKKEREAQKEEAAAKKARKAARLSTNAAAYASRPELEKQLKKIATKGVVALFNAITKHQRSIAAPAGSEASSSAITGGTSSQSFLELLQQSTNKLSGAAAPGARTAAPKAAATVSTAAAGRPGTWSVLRDDFVDQLAAKARQNGGRSDSPDILDELSDADE